MYHSTTVSAYNRAFEEIHQDSFNKMTQQQLKNMLLVMYEVESHPKANLLFEIAWEKGHASGFVEVLNEFDDMVPLIR